VDDNIQGTLLLDWPVEVQLQGRNTQECQLQQSVLPFLLPSTTKQALRPPNLSLLLTPLGQTPLLQF
jgi:hypothetical protein